MSGSLVSVVAYRVSDGRVMAAQLVPSDVAAGLMTQPLPAGQAWLLATRAVDVTGGDWVLNPGGPSPALVTLVAMTPTVSKLEIRADGDDEAVINGLPSPVGVLARFPDGRSYTDTVPGTVLRVRAQGTGAIELILAAPGYFDFPLTITAY